MERRLSAAGFRHFLDGGDRLMLEVYPHPATIVLFNRTTIFRCKKGKLGARRAGLGEYRSAVAGLAEGHPPLLSSPPLTYLLDQPLTDLPGRLLKAYEDQLDALFCAYLAAFAWCWRDQRVEFIGDRATGSIMIPTHTMQGFEWPAAQQLVPADNARGSI
jgi:predicted RNase H-like nuclease